MAGNKSDQTDQRVVTTKEAQEYADSVGCEYIETSSKDDINIKQVFEALLRGVIKEPKEQEEPETKPDDVPEQPEKKPEQPGKKPEKPQNPEPPIKETEGSGKKEKGDKKPVKAEAEKKPSTQEKLEEPGAGEAIKLGGDCKHVHHHRHHERPSCRC